MDWRVELADQPTKVLERASSADRARLLEALVDLSSDPLPRGGRIKILRGMRDRHLRLRVGERRIVYRLDEEERTVVVLAIIARGQLDLWIRRQR